jgi:hypothetical protein
MPKDKIILVRGAKTKQVEIRRYDEDPGEDPRKIRENRFDVIGVTKEEPQLEEKNA